MKRMRRFLQGSAVLMLAALMLGMSFTARAAFASPQQHPHDADYHQVFVENLADVLHTSPDTVTRGMRDAALRTVQQAVNNGDLTEGQARQTDECIRQRNGVDALQCLHDRGLGLGHPEEDRQQGQGAHSGTDYRNVFVGNLAAVLGTDWDTLVSAMRQAALRTVNRAVENGDLTRNEAISINDCIYQRGGLDFMQCLHDRGFAFGHGAEGRGFGQEDGPREGGRSRSGENYRNVFIGNLAALLETDWDSLVNAMQEAAYRTVRQAEVNGDLTSAQASRVNECIRQRGGLDSLQCLRSSNLGMGQREGGGTGSGSAPERRDYGWGQQWEQRGSDSDRDTR